MAELLIVDLLRQSFATEGFPVSGHGLQGPLDGPYDEVYAAENSGQVPQVQAQNENGEEPSSLAAAIAATARETSKPSFILHPS
jgi:hypothetical protein